MANQTLCVCNETRESVVCEKANLLDTARTPFNAFIRQLSQISDVALWLNPFRGIPQMPGLTEAEVVLLDGDAVVLEYILDAHAEEIDERNHLVASALVLPASTITSAEIHTRDQLRICNAETRIEWSLDIARGYAIGRKCPCFRDRSEQSNSLSRTLEVQDSIAKLRATNNTATQLFATAEKRKPTWNHLLEWAIGGDKNTDRRRGKRSHVPLLVAYYWAGKKPKAFSIANISPTGFYLITKDRWELGTRFLITLQRTNCDIEDYDSRLSVLCKVVRSGQDGVGFELIAPVGVDPQSGNAVLNERKHKNRQLQFLQIATGSNQ